MDTLIVEENIGTIGTEQKNRSNSTSLPSNQELQLRPRFCSQEERKVYQLIENETIKGNKDDLEKNKRQKNIKRNYSLHSKIESDFQHQKQIKVTPKENENQNPIIPLHNQVKAICFSILTSIIFAIQYFLIKDLIINKNYSGMEQLIVRGIIITIISMGGMNLKKLTILDILPSDSFYLQIKVVLMVGMSFLLFYTIEYIPLSTFSILFFTFPLFLPLFSYFINSKWHFTRNIIICQILGILGCVFIFHPKFLFTSAINKQNGTSDESEDISEIHFYILLLLPLITGALQALNISITKKFNRIVHVLTLHFLYGIPCVVLSGFIFLVIQQEAFEIPWKWMGLVCLLHSLSFVQSLFLFFARKEKANPMILKIIPFCQIVLAFIGEFSLYDVDFEWSNIVGAIFIVGSSITALLQINRLP